MKSVLKTRSAKTIIWTFAILLAICIAAAAFYLIVVPFGANGYFYWFGCVEITNNEINRPPANISDSFQVDGYYYPKIKQGAHLAYMALQLKLITYETTDDVPTDAAIQTISKTAKIQIIILAGRVFKTFFILYFLRSISFYLK